MDRLGKTALGCVRLAGVLAATFKQSSSYSAASRKYNMGAFFAQWCKTLTPLAVWGENRIFPEKNGVVPFK